MMNQNNNKGGTYIDLFSGCGGLSLGLGNAGWQGIFAVEKDSMAFETFRHNLIDGPFNHFDWPEWLPKKSTTIQTLLKNHKDNLIKLKGKVDLIAGGPPCQGFSLAGMRNPNDPRNKLSQQYIEMVNLIKPKFLLLENVRGFNSAFTLADGRKSKVPYSMIVKAKLENLGYAVYYDYVSAEKFGVPQQRTRFIMIGIRNDLTKSDQLNPFDILEEIREVFLAEKGLPNKVTTVKQAISDLELSQKGANLIHHSGAIGTGFKQIDYVPPLKPNPYQSLMRKGLGKNKPNSLRLARHRMQTIANFQLIQSLAKPGIGITDDLKEVLGTKKQVISFLDPNKPSKTLTTLPDDLLHYSEPRILTVRESARIQSFPDNFEFRGKYTTGGIRRTQECPRYTQVGNAVPPLLGEALGKLVCKLSTKCN